MKVGLVCNDNIRDDLLQKFQSLNMEVYEHADLYVVEAGLHLPHLPCIVFNPNELDELFAILSSIVPTAASSKIVGFQNDAYYVINEKNILYFEAVDAGVLCHTGQDAYQLKEKLYQLEARLPSEQFIKVSRSFIIHIDTVTQIIPWFNRRLLLKFENSKKEVEVSKSYAKSFKEFLGMR